MFLKLLASESPGRLVKFRFLASTPKSDAAGLGCSLRTYISNTFPDDADGPGTRHFENHWFACWLQLNLNWAAFVQHKNESLKSKSYYTTFLFKYLCWFIISLQVKAAVLSVAYRPTLFASYLWSHHLLPPKSHSDAATLTSLFEFWHIKHLPVWGHSLWVFHLLRFSSAFKYLANFFTVFRSLLKSHLLSDEAYPHSILHLLYVLTYICEKLKIQTYRSTEQIGVF